MRNWLLLGLLAGLALTVGCATVTMTREENLASQRQIANLDMRQMADDCNLIWLVDRQPRMTKWQTR